MSHCELAHARWLVVGGGVQYLESTARSAAYGVGR